jgi:sulfotransferase family protein
MTMRGRIVSRTFIVGCARSGTTLLQAILAAHPSIHSFPESHFFSKTMRLSLPAAKESLFGFLEQARLMRFQKRIASSRYKRSLAKSFVQILDEATLSQQKDRWVEKTPLHLHHIEEIKRQIPDANFIHIIRNPVNTVLSLHRVSMAYPETWTKRSLDACIRRWTSDVQISLSHVNSPGHYLLRYENLVSNSERTLMHLCETLGITYVASMVGQHSEVAKQLVLPHEEWKNRVISSPTLSFAQVEKNSAASEAENCLIQQRTESVRHILETRLPVLKLPVHPENTEGHRNS